MAKNQSATLNAIEAKRWLRRYLIRQRQNTPLSIRRQASRSILSRLVNSPIFKRARVVATYIGFASEVQTDGLIEACWDKKKKTLVPMTIDGFERPFFVLFKRGDSLRKTPFGPLELLERRTPFRFSTIDLVIVPGLGFDAEGYRLGYGGGVYDRLLSKTPRAKHIGLFYAQQKIHKIPREKHDHPLHAVITEKETLAPS